MVDSFIEYLSLCFRDVPGGVFVGAVVVFCVGAVLFLSFSSPRIGMKRLVGLLLSEYLILLVFLTVLTRNVQAERTYNFTPFWTYRAMLEGKPLSAQVILNILSFIPIGLMYGFLSGRIKWLNALLISGGFSLLIEMLQFIFKRGFAEFDDVFHNVLGCAIGCGMFVGITWLVKRFRL